VTIDAPSEDHDAILLDRVAGWASTGPVSFLRANKPVWRLEVIRHDPGSLTSDAADAVADSALVLHLLELERRGTAPRSRRELLLRAMRCITVAFALTREQRQGLHREGYLWAVELGRWDDEGVAALERRFLEARDGIAALLASPCDPDSEHRWASLAPGPAETGVERARRTIGHHANRLGVFAEAEAILHYFLFRLDAE
jgi:hypothetical protein